MNLSPKKSKGLDWPNVMFLAEAEQEEFADVQIMTLYAYCLNISEEQNVNLYSVSAGEHVQIFPDRVVIVIDADVIDEESTARALDFLTQVDNFEVGTFTQISPKRSFNYKKLH